MRCWTFEAQTVCTFKWSPGYHPDKEYPVIPIWVTINRLPLHLLDAQAIHRIGSLLGGPVKVDESTLQSLRHDSASLCIEIDVSSPPPLSVHVKLKDLDFFFICTYEKVHPYCSHWPLLHTWSPNKPLQTP